MQTPVNVDVSKNQKFWILRVLPTISGNNLFTPTLLIFLALLGFFLMKTELADNINFYQTSFLFACFVIAIKLFIYNFSFLQSLFNQRRHRAVHLTFNLLALVVEVYLFFLIPKTLIESSVPSNTLQQLGLMTLIWSVQVFVNRGLNVRNVIIFQLVIYVLGFGVIELFNQFLLNNFYLTVRLFQLLGSLSVFTEVLMLLQVNRLFIDRIEIDKVSIDKVISADK